MRFVTILAAVLLSAGCGIRDPCSNVVVSNSVSPDGKYEATAFIRDCGATTDFSPQVHLRPKGKPLGNTGNVFVGNHSDNIEIQWLSSTQLAIRSACDVSMIVTNFEGIAILHMENK